MYTLVGQKCGTVLLDPRTTGVVNSESVTRQSTITDNPVEGGGNIQDHVFCQPLTIQLQGTAINGADTIATLGAMWKKGDILTYTGRNRITNLVIQNLQSTHAPDNRNGFSFSATLKQITIGSSEASGTATTMSAQDATAAAANPTGAKSSLPASQTGKTKSDHDLLQRLRILCEQLQQQAQQQRGPEDPCYPQQQRKEVTGCSS